MTIDSVTSLHSMYTRNTRQPVFLDTASRVLRSLQTGACIKIDSAGHSVVLYNLFYLFVCQNVRPTIFRLSFTVQQAGQTGGCTALISALKPRQG